MDQDSRTDESRERALSSEPSSTRPNPFDDDNELSARKRRRTSLAGSLAGSLSASPTASLETALPRENGVAASDTQDMKIDTPEPTLPSTPARPDQTAEPTRSSKVTINLRNPDSLGATPTSPASPVSPTPSRQRPDHVRASVEAPEVSMAPARSMDDGSSPSTLDSPGPARVGAEDVDDDVQFSMIEPPSSPQRPIDLHSIMTDFPYRYEGELLHETVTRLSTFFRQPPGHADEILGPIHSWLDLCLACVRPEVLTAIRGVNRETRLFWSVLPDLFYQFGQRLHYTKTKEIRDLVNQLLAQFAKLAALFLAFDVSTLSQGVTEESLAGLMSPNYLRTLAALPPFEEPYLANGVERNTPPSNPIEIFQSGYGTSLATVISFVEYHTTALSRSPKMIMDNLMASCYVVQPIIRDAFQKQAYPTNVPQSILDRSRDNLTLGYKCFNLLSNAIDTVIEKSINTLSQENATNMAIYSSEILKHVLQSHHPEAILRVQQYRQESPQVAPQYVCEAMALEWRFQIYCKLIRSRQMQLRVSAASSMCEDLVTQWKRYQDRQHEPAEETQPYLDYLRYLSGFVTRTGIVDYILGPTCHPEITSASGNIIGFLGVTKTYTVAQTDMLWQTLTSTQDPRIAEALIKMMIRITGLLQPEDLRFFLEKFQNLPIDSFTPMMREFFDNITDLLAKSPMSPTAPTASSDVCIRLLRESSTFTAQGSIAYPDIYQFAQMKLKRLLNHGPIGEVQHDIMLRCLQDVAARSETASGSLQVLTIVSNTTRIHEMVAEHDFIRVLVNDLEATVQSAKSVGVTKVYGHPFCQARRRFISHIMTQFGSAIDTDLGQRLWDNLVGDLAVSHDDRKLAWDDLYSALKRNRSESQFLKDCVRLFLPRLSPSCHCYGSLAFVREVVMSATSDANGVVLDDEESVNSSGIELLWHMILTTPDQSIAQNAISTLVNEIYVNSPAILSYPTQRARKVHFALVHRCLSQLKSAAEKLKAFDAGTTSNDDESMVIVATNDQQLEQELRFARTLQVLTTLSSTLRTTPNFAAPDLRSLMLSSPNTVNGELAGLKYQSFDGGKRSKVKPLAIGLKNSVASLLASLREATGFDNYRLYYRGTAFTPSDADICRSLEDLKVRNGLILVKRENDSASSPVRIKPGASPLQIEILGHFSDLWEYLSMGENLAREIYKFLISLPANDSILAAFETAGTSTRDVFPLGQPFKSLYAIHALREYLHTRRLKSSIVYASSHEETTMQHSTNDRKDAVEKAVSLIVSALCDPDVIDKCSNEGMRLQLGLELVDTLIQLLKETMEPHGIGQLLTPALHERLMTILISGSNVKDNNLSADLITRCFEALLECCTKSDEFWAILKGQGTVGEATLSPLLFDERPFVRKSIAKLINTKCMYDDGRSSVLAIDFAELFWPIMLQLLPEAISRPQTCEEFFTLTLNLAKMLMENGSSVLDRSSCSKLCGDLLLLHASTEDVATPEAVDKVAYGLISLLHQCITQMPSATINIELSQGFLKKVFLKHLFPLEDEMGPLVPHTVINPASRLMLYDILYALAKDNPPQMITILQNLNRLTTHQTDGVMDTYKYDLSQGFDRANALRSACGYSGLRNLSNTCYLNSLFTQLFMNIGFRQFMLHSRIDRPHAQHLLSETQILFAHLQDSRRRFIDPTTFIEQITTYEEAPVDIHSQMDVDEFFNLLFDRWEGQFLVESQKKALRSVYGGQLVQQVKSKECEHISERIEPFSAIQCDIKGKSGLEESLQAYVDGEIMEGDNKYKCSTCDRHVDAVKRACLKDLPDNLIFHLKRFDFNLRLLQRSKINDYFPFPNKIDMRPYTVEHLSDPTLNAEPDIFELVGVLVHSGTAETGHYYSFIRERPTGGDAASWVEFNDDIVASWDPAQMEYACFGGADNGQYDNGNIYDKVFSAYMLFYQRSSSLHEERELLKANGNPRRLRIDMPPELELQVKLENWSIVQRHNLYDPSHIPFLMRTLEFIWGGKCSKEHKKENLAMRVALGHFDQIASRAKDLPDFEVLSGLIATACRRCSLCCFAFFQYFQQHKEALRMLLFKNSESCVRHFVGENLLYVLKKLKHHYPDEYAYMSDEGDGASTSSNSRPTILEAATDLFLYIWDTFHTRIGSWPEYFGTMVDFAKFGRLESAALLDRDFLAKIIMAISADQGIEQAPQYSRLVMAVSRRIASRPPNYEGMIALADILMDCMDTDMSNYVEDCAGRLSMAQQDEPIPFTAHEINSLHKLWGRADAGVFADKLIQLNQNPVATDSIIGRLVTSNPGMDAMILRSLLSSITGQITSQPITPYLRAGLTYCASSLSRDHVHRLIRHVSEQCRTVQNADARSFFEFHRDVFDGARNTGEGSEDIQLHGLRSLPVWIAGLLGYPDRTVSAAVEAFLREKLFRHGPIPIFEEAHGGAARSEAMVTAARELAINLLNYLRETYVMRGAQASRDMMQPFHRVLHQCDPYFREHGDLEDGLARKYSDLCPSVIDAMNNLTVEAIEDDGSDWEQSIGSSDSFAELSNMQVDQDPMDGN